MKKLLLVLLALACLAWSDDYGDRGTYGSTAYGSTAYGSTAYGSTAYGSTAYGSTAYGEKGYGTAGYDGAENPKSKAKSSKEAPSSSSSSSIFGSLLSKIAPASQTASSASGASGASSAGDVSSAKPKTEKSGDLKPYKFRLVFDLDGLFYDADRIRFNGLGVGANVQAFMRSGQGKFFVEYGLGLGLSSWTYEDSYYDDIWEWWVYNIDALVQGGLQLGNAILRFGGYVGYLKDNDVRYGYYDDNMLVNNYHYGIALGASYYFSRVELGVVFRDDLSEINPEIGKMDFGKKGFISGGFSVGLVF